MTNIKQKTTPGINLATKVERLYSVGPAYSKRLSNLGIQTVKDLLLHFPARYDDLSISKPLIEARTGDTATFKVKLLNITSRRTKNRGLTITEAIVQDDSSSIKVVFFNQPYLTKVLKPGDTLVLAGKVEFKPYLGRYISNPSYEKAFSPSSPHLGRIVPIYPETKGITSKWLRSRIKPLLKFSHQLEDYLPSQIKDSVDLINLDEAIRQIHFPEYKESFREAIRRLAFDELFMIALKAQISRREFKSQKSYRIEFDEKKISQFVKNLPFKLTNAQRKAAWEIIQDLNGLDKSRLNEPMNRLLNGDVGSGKTIVAALAAFSVCLNGKQTAVLSPTEVLALQHYKNFCQIFKDYEIQIELLTSSYHLRSDKEKKLEKNMPLNSDIIIGTHAIIQKGVFFRDLALAVIDEQHRFGVKQRAQIKKENLTRLSPHLLSMTATPIPRSLSLALYGDLDISILNESPKGRKRVITKIVPPKNRKKVYQFIHSQIDQGRQAFFICPLIEKKDSSMDVMFDFDNRKAAIEEQRRLAKNIFPDLRVGLLHGKMKAEKKDKIMRDFKNKKIDILVSTSVVEVGVDVPNATVIFIEGAERFGLSQLHQFRGRVGRAEYQSYCFLSTEIWSDKIRERLKIIETTSDGFKISEADLKLRGPGEVYGTKQHGLADLRFASLFDEEMIKLARQEAERLVLKDPSLRSWPILTRELSRFEKETHME